LDSGAWLTTKDRDTNLPRPVHALLVENKNRRLTLYPRHPEVHQLLDKAAEVQQHNPGLPVVPLLICRRGHPWLFWMAKDLGFLVHAANKQYLSLPKGTDERLLEEVRTGLAATDLEPVTATKRPRIVNLFEKTLPAQAHGFAQRWTAVGSITLRRALQTATRHQDEGVGPQPAAERAPYPRRGLPHRGRYPRRRPGPRLGTRRRRP
jgi:hypothetical protein